jgi:anti-sigma factor RsiW
MQNEEREIMNRWSCHDDWLVEYADGLLLLVEQAAADEHLRGCAACRRELAALQQSLSLVRRHWERPLVEPLPVTRGAVATGVQLPERSGSSERWPIAGMLMRAALVVAVVGTLAWQLTAHRLPLAPQPPTVAVVTPEPRSSAEPAPPNTANSPATDNIELWLQQQTQAARLRAASALLADEPGMAERSEQLARYATEAYGP